MGIIMYVKDSIKNQEYDEAVSLLKDFLHTHIGSEELYFYLAEAILLKIRYNDSDCKLEQQNIRAGIKALQSCIKLMKTKDDFSVLENTWDVYLMLCELHLRSPNPEYSLNDLLELQKALPSDKSDGYMTFLTSKSKYGLSYVCNTCSGNLYDAIRPEKHHILDKFRSLFEKVFEIPHSKAKASSLLDLNLENVDDLYKQTTLPINKRSLEVNFFMQSNCENNLSNLKQITKRLCDGNVMFGVVHHPFQSWTAYQSLKKLKKRYHLFFGNVSKELAKSIILLRIMETDDRVLQGNYTDDIFNEATFISKKNKLPIKVISLTLEKEPKNYDKGLKNVRLAVENCVQVPIIIAICFKELKPVIKSVIIQSMINLITNNNLTVITREDETEVSLEQFMKSDDHFLCVNNSVIDHLDCGRMVCTTKDKPYSKMLNINCTLD